MTRPGTTSKLRVPPWQWDAVSSGGWVSSGKLVSRIPQAPLSATRFWVTVSKRPPETTIPVPGGPSAALPALGTFGLLLSWMKLLRKVVQDWDVLPGQRPTCGEGASSLFCELVTMPVLFRSHSEFSITRWPPELVPE